MTLTKRANIGESWADLAAHLPMAGTSKEEKLYIRSNTFKMLTFKFWLLAQCSHGSGGFLVAELGPPRGVFQGLMQYLHR
jgi:hypothetical protein